MSECLDMKEIIWLKLSECKSMYHEYEYFLSLDYDSLFCELQINAFVRYGMGDRLCR